MVSDGILGELLAADQLRKLPAAVADAPVLLRAENLRMIADSWPDRPIYISRTTGNYAEQLGLGERADVFGRLDLVE